jgi:hypothetical protein
MTAFDTGEIKSRAKSNFTDAWIATAKLIPTNTEIFTSEERQTPSCTGIDSKVSPDIAEPGF